MVIEKVKIDQAGRLVVPAQMRKELALEPGTQLTIRVENGGLRLETQMAAVKRLQEYMRQFKKPGQSIVDEFLEERREEARREVEEMDKPWNERS